MTTATPTVGSLIHEIDRLVKKRFDRFAETTGMSRAQWHVLAHVAKKQGINQASLADLVGVEPITICRMVDRLEALGLLERQPDPNDRRARLIHMTETARPGLERMRSVALALFAEALEGFTSEEEAMLTRLLVRIHANLLAATNQESPLPLPMSVGDPKAIGIMPDQKD